MQKLATITAMLLASLALVSPVHAKAKPKAKPEVQNNYYDDLVFRDTRGGREDDDADSDDPMMEAMEIASGSARKHSGRHCWRAVKKALVEANVLPYRPTSRYAWQAAQELVEKFDFLKLDITDPYEAPVGSILVYGGRGAGHVEFRTPDGFVSDFANPRPSKRPLIGVFVSSKSVSANTDGFKSVRY